MYFGSPGFTKGGTYASAIGGYTYDTSLAWASNFRGPYPVTGGSSRTQWEWYDSAPGGLSVTWDHAGSPYLYGRQCVSVVPGGAPPHLTSKTETVYEDDECVGWFCNPDDYVGSFTIDRSFCNSEIFHEPGEIGLSTGWTSSHEAYVTNDIRRVTYKLWCYSCLNSLDSFSCSNGVAQILQ